MTTTTTTTTTAAATGRRDSEYLPQAQDSDAAGGRTVIFRPERRPPFSSDPANNFWEMCRDLSAKLDLGAPAGRKSTVLRIWQICRHFPAAFSAHVPVIGQDIEAAMLLTLTVAMDINHNNIVSICRQTIHKVVQVQCRLKENSLNARSRDDLSIIVIVIHDLRFATTTMVSNQRIMNKGGYKPLLALLTKLGAKVAGACTQNESRTYILDPANLGFQLRQAAEQDDVVLLNAVRTIRPFNFLFSTPEVSAWTVLVQRDENDSVTIVDVIRRKRRDTSLAGPP